MRLEQELRRCLKRIDQLSNQTFGQSRTETIGDVSAYDNHPADQGTEMYERSRDVGMFNETMDELQSVENALERLHQGQYGICSRCGRPIPYSRLEILPATSVCAGCARRGKIW